MAYEVSLYVFVTNVVNMFLIMVASQYIVDGLRINVFVARS